MNRTLRRVIPWVVAIVLVAGGAAVYWKRGSEGSGPTYRTELVSRGSISETVTSTGTISAVTTVQVGSQVSGIIARLHADFNSPVRRGQLLAELDPTPFEAQVEQRRADLLRFEVQARAAEVDFRRSERLVQEGLTSAADYDAARANADASRAQVAQAAAALSQANTNLRYTKILSPIDGVVVDRQYDVGQTVAASFQAPTLFTIAQDLTKMQVQADVDQADIGKIRVGQPARFTVDAYPEQDFEGQISQIRLNATVNQNVITYPVILAVANPDERLRPKMTANVTIVVESRDGVLRVPNAALRFRPVATGAEGQRGESAGRRGPPEPAADPSGRASGAEAAGARAAGRPQTVYVIEDQQTLQPVGVRTGITDGRFTAILAGELDEGDPVVVGLVTSKVEGSGSFPGAGPAPGTGRGGGRRGM